MYGLLGLEFFLVDRFGTEIGPWLGLHQPPNTAEPDAGWLWDSGEQLGYRRWLPNEPNDFMGIEDFVHYRRVVGAPDSTWNDFPNDGFQDDPKVPGYIVEFDGDRLPDIARPTNYVIDRGTQSGGNLASLQESDDDRITIRQRPPFLVSDPSVRLVAFSQAPTGTPSLMRVKFEVNCTGIPSSRVRQRVSVRNYDTGQWEMVDERVPSTNDFGITVQLTGNLGRFVDDSTREVRLKLEWFDLGTLSPGWGSAIDRVRWEFLP